MKKVVILSTRPPYGSSINAEAFRAGLGLAFSETIVDLILIGDGVYSALREHEPQRLQMKPMSDVYKNIADFNINLFIDEISLKERNLKTEELITSQIISNDELKNKINKADIVLTF